MTETICAIATPPGRGGVGVVRISGTSIDDLAARLIGHLPEPRHAALVKVLDADGQAIDTGLALYFPAPHSFTGEHVLELQLHGSPVVLEMVLRACVAAGARRAGPGEFSQRAFLNDKLDLAQAEAIADLIAASSEQAARAATRSLDGVFSKQVHALADRIIELRVYVEAALDFPDEEIDFLAEGDVLGRVRMLVDQAVELLAQARAGRLLNDGLRIAIVGKPNAGKSSLFNALVKRDAAIVTEIPGTTRDVVRETIHLAGIPVTLADTAGLRETEDVVEREGVRRARAELAEADLVLWVVDVNDPEPGPPPETSVPVLRIENKIDLASVQGRSDPSGAKIDAVALSALTGEGMDGLDRAVSERFMKAETSLGEFTARARHVDQIESCLSHLDAARGVLEQTGSGELAAEELRRAAEALGEITGQVHSDELLGKIFSSFCIGK
ncbi:MAG: tRNA uridine-5-carboxymethylaminomethyl(34) synthesis GTPase MnmE [Xanthomonadales bacterium]|nr:tRNA uridine-5-carboxymethylaminomethyl(34) synthesis GTPase MnmE [Xanthomonadales bacterium]|tara:strand:+ start:11 stop:1339 length:1329 start_codon:yes stop_codon:yes gene_type:complete